MDIVAERVTCPIYRCAKSQYCRLPGRVDREGTGMHYHVGGLYPVMLYAPAPKPRVIVAAVDREHGQYVHYQRDGGVVRFEVIRRSA